MRIIKNISDILIVSILTIIPTYFWYVYTVNPYSFSTLDSTSLSLAQITGTLGTVYFCLDFLLSARFKVVERLFGGLNKEYTWHKYLGEISFILLLFHPLFIGIQYVLTSSGPLLAFFFPEITDVAKWAGRLSFLIVVVLLFITLFVDLKYNIWKLTHQFIGVALALGFMHVFLIPSALSTNIYLKVYLLILFGIAAFSFIHKVLLGKYMIKKYGYKIKQINMFGPKYVEVVMTPVKERMMFLPGQFIFVQFFSNVVGREVHPFSISSSPNDKELRIIVKALGDFTQKLKMLKPGDLVKIEGPYGAFLATQSVGLKQIWIAGGIGITPFLSEARSLEKNTSYNIDLYYVVDTEEDAIDQEELFHIEKQVSGFKVIRYMSKANGRIDASVISNFSPDLLKRDIFLCGPPGLVHSIKKGLRDVGVKKRKIHIEEFNLH